MLNFLEFVPHILNQMGIFPILFLFILIVGIYKKKDMVKYLFF